MFDPTIPYTLFTKWRKIQTEQNVLKCGKKLIFLNVSRMFLYQYMLESRLSRWTRCCSLSFSLNQLFYVQVDYSYLCSEKETNTLVIYRKINTLAACIIIENFSGARKISECRQQMHLLENEKSIRSLPKPVRQRNSKILLAVIYSARRQQFSSRGFFKPKWLTLVITFLSHGIFRCSRIRSARRLQLEDVSSLDFPPAKIRPV